MQECQDSAFWQRSVPLSVFGGIGVYTATRTGHIKPFSKFGGPWPKTLLGCLLGFGAGKLTSGNKFVERFASEQPNSMVTWTLRKRFSQGKPFVISSEELLLGAQCKSEAFWKRGIPGSLSLAAFVNYCIAKNLLSPSATLGIWPKTISAAIVGYYVAMVSYRTKRMERFLTELPDSHTSKEYRLYQ